MSDQDRLPHDAESEMAVIGSMLIDPSVIDDVAVVVRGSDFYDAANAILFDAITLLRADAKPIDIRLVVTHLREIGKFDAVGGAAYLAKLSGSVANASHAVPYARTVAGRAKLRRLTKVAQDAICEASDHGCDPVRLAEAMRASLDQISADAIDGNRCLTLHDAAKQRLDLLDHPDKSVIGPLLATGITCIDECYGGFRSGASYVAAARPGKGKSALMKQIADSLDHRGKPSLIISLEMEPHEIAARVLSQRLSIDGKFFEVDEDGTCQIPDSQMANLRQAVDDCQHSVMHIQAPTGRHATIEGITAFTRLMKAKHDIKLVAIDYLQLIHKSDRRDSDYDTVTKCSKAFKQLARELGIVVLVLSQLNRDNEKSQKSPRRPRPSDLRDSGSIEQDADAVIFLHQPDENSDDFELIVPKWRNDSPGLFNVRLVGEHTMFLPPSIQSHGNYEPAFGEYSR